MLTALFCQCVCACVCVYVCVCVTVWNVCRNVFTGSHWLQMGPVCSKSNCKWTGTFFFLDYLNVEEVLQAVGNAVKQHRGHSRFRHTAVRFIFSTDRFPAHPQWTCVEWAAKKTLTVASVTIYYETVQYPNFCLPSPFTFIFFPNHLPTFQLC